MPTIILCPACGRKLKIPDHFVGGRAKCTGCNNRLEITLFSDGSYETVILPSELVQVQPTLENPPAPPPLPKRRVAPPPLPPRLSETEEQRDPARWCRVSCPNPDCDHDVRFYY